MKHTWKRRWKRSQYWDCWRCGAYLLDFAMRSRVGPDFDKAAGRCSTRVGRTTCVIVTARPTQKERR